jgi:hypothetical protein
MFIDLLVSFSVNFSKRRQRPKSVNLLYLLREAKGFYDNCKITGLLYIVLRAMALLSVSFQK